MHYKTPDVSASLAGRLAGIEPFLAALGGGVKVQKITATSLTLAKSSLPGQLTVFALPYR